MIAWLSFVVAVPALAVVELPQPDAKSVAVGLAAPRESLTFDAAECLAEVMMRGTSAYSGGELRALGRQVGTPLRVRAVGDFMLITAEVASGPNALTRLSDLTYQLSQAASLFDQDVNRRMSARWEQAEDPIRVALGLDRRAKWSAPQLRDGYRRTFARANMKIVVLGKFEAGSATAEFQRRFAELPVTSSTFSASRPSMTPIPFPLPTLVTVGGRQRELGPVRVIAAAALGAKSGTLWRTIRQAQRWSYDQRAILWPRRDGWEPTLVVVSTEERDRELFAKLVEDDLKLWSDDQLEVARRVAQDSLQGRTPFSAFWLDASGPIGPSLADQAGLASLSRAMGGNLQPRVLAKQLAQVTLPEVQAEVDGWFRVPFPSRD